MKKYLLAFISFFVFCTAQSQIIIDTLALQNFDTLALYSPNWPFTGPVVYNTMGTSPAASSPSNSPTGIAGSNSWETTTQSGGLVLTFTTISIPAGYDSIRAKFSLAAMNLLSAGGGPDSLDYVLMAVSFNGGPYYNRLRIRGFRTAGCFWPYTALNKAKLYYQPQTEIAFNQTASGLQTINGYGNCEIVFPGGSVSTISIRITGRSSSSTDTWLVDNVLLTGEKLATGINSVTKNNSIKIYPNPANDAVSINRVTNINSTLFVYNTLGELVITRELSKENETVNISSLSNGVYFFKVDGITKKVVKH